ncbi:MAG: CHAP domain-containing protein [Lachnospiraceae bacterium]|jgi:hypothetical protein|nr:CHAP domain-containing protein [Lachnospiraceae bacterium]
MGKQTQNNLYSKTENAGKDGFSKYWEQVFPGKRNCPFCTAFVYWVFGWAYGKKRAKLMLLSHKGFVQEPFRLELRFQKMNRYSHVPCIGNIAFFQQHKWTDHVGIVTDIDEHGFYSVEGNVVDEQGIPCVAKRYHFFSEKAVKGFGYPLYSLLLKDI